MYFNISAESKPAKETKINEKICFTKEINSAIRRSEIKLTDKYNRKNQGDTKMNIKGAIFDPDGTLVIE